MQGGDLANDLLPRLVLVFENLVGILPEQVRHRAVYSSFVKAKRWRRAVNLLQVNEPLARQMWHVTWHLHHQIEVVTWLNPDAVEPLQAWVDRNDLPVHRVWHIEPNKLARKIATMPDLAAVLDRKSTRLNSSHPSKSRMPSSA